MFKTSWKEAKTLSDRRFGEQFNAPIIPSGAFVQYSATSAQECGKDFLVAYTELESMDESEIYFRRINAKEVFNAA